MWKYIHTVSVLRSQAKVNIVVKVHCRWKMCKRRCKMMFSSQKRSERWEIRRTNYGYDLAVDFIFVQPKRWIVNTRKTLFIGFYVEQSEKNVGIIRFRSRVFSFLVFVFGFALYFCRCVWASPSHRHTMIITVNWSSTKHHRWLRIAKEDVCCIVSLSLSLCCCCLVFVSWNYAIMVKQHYAKSCLFCTLWAINIRR